MNLPPFTCPGCGSRGFQPSASAGRCTFCDGTRAGQGCNPPPPPAAPCERGRYRVYIHRADDGHLLIATDSLCAAKQVALDHLGRLDKYGNGVLLYDSLEDKFLYDERREALINAGEWRDEKDF